MIEMTKDEKAEADKLMLNYMELARDYGLCKASSLILCCWVTFDSGFRGDAAGTKKFIEEFVANCFKGDALEHIQKQVDKVKEIMQWEKTRRGYAGEQWE